MHPDPIATYRLQLRPGFGFREAADLTGYLADLGVSHLYLSPCLQAAEGSSHGYDGVDPGRVSEALGGEEAFAGLCETAGAAGLGIMIDVVPNHLAAAGRQNPWWWDVLENGPSSRYAAVFDMDWQAAGRPWPDKVLLPLLGDHYGRVLEAGHLRLSHREGTFVLTCFEHGFPVDPASLAPLLQRAGEAIRSGELNLLALRHAILPRPIGDDPAAVADRDRESAELADLRARLCRQLPEAARAIEAEVARLNGDPDALDDLMEQQHYRLCHWRLGNHRLGYRRFFDIKELVGVRVEEAAVFRATHALILSWVKKGWVQGLRIDHPDGLRDPAGYFQRLREACPDAWIVAEKILGEKEAISPDWPIEGTTGYDFLNLVSGLFVDPGGKEALTRIYGQLTGEGPGYPSLVERSKRRVLTELFGAELDRLTRLFVDICHRHRRHRDHAPCELREALRETAVYFPVYRTYVPPAGGGLPCPDDEGRIRQAIQGALAASSDGKADLFDFLRDLLLLRVGGSLGEELALRFQQLTGPAMAKGVEDTALYRYHRLVALNEVGGNPDRFGVSTDAFHLACAEAREKRPLSLLATSTHDTKRSEDVRCRLALLSEAPEPWAAAVRRWTDLNERHRNADAPERHTEYLFYQTLVGAWPIDPARMSAYMEKAVREAKTQSSWIRPNRVYEAGLRDFIQGVMADATFLSDLEGFVTGLMAAGRVNSLAQTLIKLTAPGIPDLYQGTELWDLSLVDPDNRRPVDFPLRRRLLVALSDLSPEKILERMAEGLPKLWVIRQALDLRRQRPELFGPGGGYRPLQAQGPKAGHVVAFLRGEAAATVTPRLVLGLKGQWADTELTLPAGTWRNRLTGEMVEAPVRLQTLLARFPVALLVKKEGADG
jgi:(1->4)-alpha-D-glucan 1-alpha-D-glucosylmutase